VSGESPVDDAEVLGRIISSMKTLDDEGRMRIYQTIGAFFELDGGTHGRSRPMDPPIADGKKTTGLPTTDSGFSADRAPKPKQFLNEKQPRTDVERVACLAFYLTHYRDTPEFTTLDISKLNTEAAQRKLSNATAAVNNASQYGYLVPAGKGMKQITAAGERYVQSLPDYDAAKDAMAAARPRWRSRKNGKNAP
jgi:hypothetical protein